MTRSRLNLTLTPEERKRADEIAASSGISTSELFVAAFEELYKKTPEKTVKGNPLPAVVFCRRYRWTVEGKNMDGGDLPEGLVKTIAVDRIANTVKIDVYEVDNDMLARFVRWAAKEITWVTYDGKGEWIFRETYAGLKLISDAIDLNYSDSEELTRSLKYSYMKIDRVYREKSC